MFKTFISEERGDIVQYIIILALLAVVLAFAAPWIKKKMIDQQTGASGGMDEGMKKMPAAIG
ncbi:hypothetical protein bcgnr5378_29780 [Bacillus cereus]|uniref:Uncharacterized protein n=1 Tax=Bacillus cereus TaxID=1396 RepID=A0A162PIK3_BACCE|nr:hypothetical protein [Bacillus cereus]KZD72135.1 hypothetical protein B4088_0596 [Bacillus cereus]